MSKSHHMYLDARKPSLHSKYLPSAIHNRTDIEDYFRSNANYTYLVLCHTMRTCLNLTPDFCRQYNGCCGARAPRTRERESAAIKCSYVVIFECVMLSVSVALCGYGVWLVWLLKIVHELFSKRTACV